MKKGLFLENAIEVMNNTMTYPNNTTYPIIYSVHTCLVLFSDSSSWNTMLWSNVTTATWSRFLHKVAWTICWLPSSSLLFLLLLLLLALRTVSVKTHLPSRKLQTLSWPAKKEEKRLTTLYAFCFSTVY